MPIDEIFPISQDEAFDLFEFLNDVSSTAEMFEVVEFTNDNDQVFYRLRWEDAYHILENVWTFPNEDDPKGWLAENARDRRNS